MINLNITDDEKIPTFADEDNFVLTLGKKHPTDDLVSPKSQSLVKNKFGFVINKPV